jgi:hypothetical protein
MANYGYYLPLNPSIYESVRLLGIEEKMEGMGESKSQKKDKDGTPVWTVSALVKVPGGIQDLETFTLTASKDVAGKIKALDDLTPIRLVGLAGGKWSKAITDKTTWSFQITAIEVIKAQQ